MQTTLPVSHHAALLCVTLRTAPAVQPLLRRHRFQILSVQWRCNRGYTSRPSNAKVQQSAAQEDMLVRMLIQDAFNPASSSSLSKNRDDSESGSANSESTIASRTRSDDHSSHCETAATKGGDGRGALGANVEALCDGGPSTPPDVASRPEVPIHTQASLRCREIPTSSIRVNDAVASVTDSRAQNVAAEPFATIRRADGGENTLRALEWLCSSCHTYNPLTSSSPTCRKCEASATTSYRSALPPVRHVAIMPTAWVCQNCSHINRQADTSALPKADKEGLARAQREKFICDECCAPFAGVQDWVCPACDHFCPRAATQCPSCFTSRPLAWTCRCCESGIQNSVFTAKCRGCGHRREEKYSNSVVRCRRCGDWNDVRWELCATCMAPMESLVLEKVKIPDAKEGTLPTPPPSESVLGNPTTMELLYDSAGMLHSKTVMQAAKFLEVARTAETATTPKGLHHDAEEPATLAPSTSSLPMHKDEQPPRLATKLPDNAWWCFTCNVAHRRNVTFCDICLESRDTMWLRNRKESASLRASTSSVNTEVASSTLSSDSEALKDAADTIIIPTTAEGDWQCPYCRKLLRVTQHECCGYRREVPYGYWLCDHCYSTNRNDRRMCLGCREPRERVCRWICQECEWHNDASNAVCLQCGLPRTSSAPAESGTTVTHDSEPSTSIVCCVCSAPNHIEKSACYRCRARLRDVEWRCDACGHGHRSRNALRCEVCSGIRQFDLRGEVWVCEVCATPVFSGGDIPVRAHCPKCNTQRAPTATHYPSRWKCECGLFNRSRSTTCVECGARRRLESLSTTATCPRCFRDTPLNVQERCMHCRASLSECFERWESNITRLVDTAELGDACDEPAADGVAGDGEDDLAAA